MMTANKRRKRRIRARVAATGESYTAALRYLRHLEENRMPNHQINPAGATDTGSVRAVNQDHLLVQGDLYAVADGMGGHRGGEVASHTALAALRAAFATEPTAEGLVAAVRAANTAVLEQASSDPELNGMGTTIAAVTLVADNGTDRLVSVNVGDSRVYLLRNGELSRLSRDHSLVADLVRSGDLEEDAAAEHPSRNILTMAVGVSPEIEPYVAETVAHAGDRVLLCSDGLFNEVPADEICSVLGEIESPAEAAERLIDLANGYGGNDNITTVVLDIS